MAVPAAVDQRRCRRLNTAQTRDGPVLYWMSRDQRIEDNWALLYAAELAEQYAQPLHVVFCLVPRFLEATWRQYDFMLKGLREVEAGLRELGTPFYLRMGKAVTEVPQLCAELGITTVVCDMSPLRVPQGWAKEVGSACGAKGIPVFQVDAHNVVPVWAASHKQEFAARTIRGKIMNALSEYLKPFPALKKCSAAGKKLPPPVDWEAAEKSLEVDRTILPVPAFPPGTKAGLARLESFCKSHLDTYENCRNDPTIDGVSGLSPYLHFGQLSAQRCALRVRAEAAEGKGKAGLQKGSEVFIEEAVVRRELSDNFCFFNDKYDSFDGAHDWAKKTLIEHENDARDPVYSLEVLEEAKTHDDLWNAAQLQMVREGKMHGFLRMYWAKKILEWSPSPQEALSRAIRLNDRYELDGRDPNGYVGCMWSICGVHDRAWAERRVMGKIRYMNYEGCKRKFDVRAFVARYPGAKAPGTADAEPAKKRAKAKAKGK